MNYIIFYNYVIHLVSQSLKLLNMKLDEYILKNCLFL